MPGVYAFRAVQFDRGRGAGRGDLSGLIAPPYDVLDASQKASMLSAEAANIVGIDLPHVPAKELGPASAYEAAGAAYRAMLARGVLKHLDTPAMFAYRQTFTFNGRATQRCGMAVTVDTRPLGPASDGSGGILPHEQTFSGPKEDRLALMRTSACQLSPIFGLHPDPKGEAAGLVRSLMGRAADATATMVYDRVLHEVWTITDPATIGAYQRALRGEDVFIADGHHRYNTAVNYLAELERESAASGTPLPPDHPARRTMMVLVSMSDPGLVIGPTHRVLGGMSGWSWEAFERASAGVLNIEPVDNDPQTMERSIDFFTARGERNVMGLMDLTTGLCFVAWPAVSDPLEDRFADKPLAWRLLDVAIVQHVIVEEICQPALNAGGPVRWAFPHTIDEVLAIARGQETGAGGKFGRGASGGPQLAVIVKPTPLAAVRDVSRAGELMPQKSTFFLPKLATGLFLNPLA